MPHKFRAAGRAGRLGEMNGSLETVASTFLQLTDATNEQFDVLELMTTLSRRCVELFDVTSSGVLLADGAHGVQAIAATSEQAATLEHLQVDNDEGPGIDAFRCGRAVSHDDLGLTSPWPGFSRAAVDAGLVSVHALPMRVRDTVVGSLNLFNTRPGRLWEADVNLAQAFAHAAAMGLLQNKTIGELHQQTAQLKRALSTRVIIEQAKGTIAERAGIGMDEAFEQLRSYARTHKMKLTSVALAVVAHTLTDAEIEIISGLDPEVPAALPDADPCVMPDERPRQPLQLLDA
jgi:transcriptional regulator with GAF, ATPase, and Fis domain